MYAPRLPLDRKVRILLMFVSSVVLRTGTCTEHVGRGRVGLEGELEDTWHTMERTFVKTMTRPLVV